MSMIKPFLFAASLALVSSQSLSNTLDEPLMPPKNHGKMIDVIYKGKPIIITYGECTADNHYYQAEVRLKIDEHDLKKMQGRDPSEFTKKVNSLILVIAKALENSPKPSTTSELKGVAYQQRILRILEQQMRSERNPDQSKRAYFEISMIITHSERPRYDICAEAFTKKVRPGTDQALLLS